MLGVAGDSATGKTTLSEGVARIIGLDRVALICTDDYHKYSRAERRRFGMAASDPENNYLDIVEQHLRLLRNGEAILKPFYDHSRGELARPAYIEPRSYIIVEGLLTFATRAMRECYDVKIYLEPDERLRLKWKLQRDTAKRGYEEAEVRQLLEASPQEAARFIQPQRPFADIVVGFHPPDDNVQETGAHLNARHMLRPTLPHPDVTPLLETSAENGITLQLARDRDGKPVDVLEISGAIDRERARRVEDLLWSLIPETSHLRADVGQFEEAGVRRRISHPLALTQLLIAYHMEMAALERREEHRKASDRRGGPGKGTGSAKSDRRAP